MDGRQRADDRWWYRAVKKCLTLNCHLARCPLPDLFHQFSWNSVCVFLVFLVGCVKLCYHLYVWDLEDFLVFLKLLLCLPRLHLFTLSIYSICAIKYWGSVFTHPHVVTKTVFLTFIYSLIIYIYIYICGPFNFFLVWRLNERLIIMHVFVSLRWKSPNYTWWGWPVHAHIALSNKKCFSQYNLIHSFMTGWQGDFSDHCEEKTLGHNIH